MNSQTVDSPKPQKLFPLIVHLKEKRFEPIPKSAQILAIPLTSVDDTKELAKIVATSLVESDPATTEAKATVIGLAGELGSGKTLFTRDFITTLIPDADVTSPTYSISQEYVYPSLLIYHLDLYRIESVDELEGIGFWEFSGLGTLSLIEWIDLYPETLSSDAVLIEFVEGKETRMAYIYSASRNNFDALSVALTGLADGTGLLFKVVTLPIPPK